MQSLAAVCLQHGASFSSPVHLRGMLKLTHLGPPFSICGGLALHRRRVNRPPPLPHIYTNRTPHYDSLGPIFLSRFLLDACSVSFTNRRSHMGIPGADPSISLSPSEVFEMRFNASRIVGNLGTTRIDAPQDVESSGAVSDDFDSEEAERDGLPAVMKDTCTRDPHVGRAL